MSLTLSAANVMRGKSLILAAEKFMAAAAMRASAMMFLMLPIITTNR